jgi:hypothetical protein
MYNNEEIKNTYNVDIETKKIKRYYVKNGYVKQIESPDEIEMSKWIARLIKRKPKSCIPYFLASENSENENTYITLNLYQHKTSSKVTQKIINKISEYGIYRLCINDNNLQQNLKIENIQSFEINLHNKYDDLEYGDVYDIEESHEDFFLLNYLEFKDQPKNNKNINLIFEVDENTIDLTIRILPEWKQKLQMQITIPNKMQLLHLHLGFADHYIYKILTLLQEYLNPWAIVELDNLEHISKELIKLQLPNVSLNIFPLRRENIAKAPIILDTTPLIRSSFNTVDIYFGRYIHDMYQDESRYTRFQNIIDLLSKRPPIKKIEFSEDEIEGDHEIFTLKAETCLEGLFDKRICRNENLIKYSNEITTIKEGLPVISRFSLLIDETVRQDVCEYIDRKDKTRGIHYLDLFNRTRYNEELKFASSSDESSGPEEESDNSEESYDEESSNSKEISDEHDGESDKSDLISIYDGNGTKKRKM